MARKSIFGFPDKPLGSGFFLAIIPPLINKIGPAGPNERGFKYSHKHTYKHRVALVYIEITILQQSVNNDAYVFGKMLILAGLLKLARPKPLAPAAGSPAT